MRLSILNFQGINDQPYLKMKKRIIVNTANVLVAIIAFFLPMITLGASSTASDQAISGTYIIVEVNGNKLPAATWIIQKDERERKIETLSGAIMLGPQGELAVIVEERELWADNSEAEPSTTVSSGFLKGSYKVLDNEIELSYETLPGTDRATLNKGILRVTSIGRGEPKGQVVEYVLHKAE